MKLVKLTSENENIWSQYLVSNSRSLFFHTIEWKNIVEKVYGFKPLYFMALDSDKVVGVLPAFFTNSAIFGCKIVTTPFNNYFRITSKGEANFNKHTKNLSFIVRTHWLPQNK